jgi:hypothetical protein
MEQPRTEKSLAYEDVTGLPAGATPEQEALASLAQSMKRIADQLDRMYHLFNRNFGRIDV